MNYLPCVEIEPKKVADAAVIWLHGLGADGHDFEPIVPELKLPSDLSVRFVFPHAPSIPVTINGGMVMPAWYDILAMDFERKIDNQQIMVSAQKIINLIEREISRGIESSKIILIGFSQGGAVAYQAALSYEKPLAGLLALSTYFATHASIQIHSANQHIPIHIFHGTNDPVVPEAMGKHAFELLKAKGLNPEYKYYPMEHAVCAREIHDISLFIQKCLSK